MTFFSLNGGPDEDSKLAPRVGARGSAGPGWPLILLMSVYVSKLAPKSPAGPPSFVFRTQDDPWHQQIAPEFNQKSGTK